MALYAYLYEPTLISADGSTVIWGGPASTDVNVTDGNATLDVFESVANPFVLVPTFPVTRPRQQPSLTTRAALSR